MLRRYSVLVVAQTVLHLLFGMVVGAYAQTKLLRFPDIHGDDVVVSYARDLWLSSTLGGHATR